MKKKYIKRFVSLLLILSMLSTFASAIAVGCDFSTYDLSGNSIEEIMSKYYAEKYNLCKNALSSSRATAEALPADTYEEQLSKLQSERNEALVSAGFTPYSVNPSNIDSIEDELQCDFDDIGLDRNESYLIVLGEEGGVSSRGTPTTGFNYTYTDGNVYQLRTLTVVPGDDEDPYGGGSLMRKFEYQLVDSTVAEVVNRLLNGAISVYVGAIRTYLGVIWSLAGINLINIGNGETLVEVEGVAAWTRIYTQVWNPNSQAWSFGSCVETVETRTKFDGYYFDKNTMSIVDIVDEGVSENKYSTYYYNANWRRNTAVQRFISNLPCSFDLIGDQVFKYKPVCSNCSSANTCTHTTEQVIGTIAEPHLFP